jgi:aldehyde:ferredoxin oxidoreductase
MRLFADPEGIKAYARETLKKQKDHKATEAYRNHGTPMMMALLNMAAFAIEASIRGKITESLAYGNADHVADILQKISRREGIGALLAEGIKNASAELGLEDIAVHVKGMEPAASPAKKWKGLQKTITVFADGVPREIFLNPFL